MKRIFILLILITHTQFGWGNGVYVEGQSGAQMGLVHVALGYQWSQNHYLGAGLGYVPDRSDHEEMSLMSFSYLYSGSTRWTIADGWAIKPFNFGTSLIIASHSDLFVSLPEQYPDEYYTPTAVRLLFHYQLAVTYGQQWDAYVDFSILDVGLASYIREPEFFNRHYDYLGLEGVTHWGVGVRYRF